jgi:hypothetical protein
MSTIDVASVATTATRLKVIDAIGSFLSLIALFANLWNEPYETDATAVGVTRYTGTDMATTLRNGTQ